MLKQKGFYAVHAARPFFKDLVDFMVFWSSFRASARRRKRNSKNRDLMGATDPRKQKKAQFAQISFGLLMQTLFTVLTLPETAAVEIAYFFPALNIYSR